MSFHWPSFLLGALSVPLLAALAALLLRWLASFTGGRLNAGRLAGGSVPGSLEPLHFTPRLIGQIRRPSPDVEGSAQAS